MRKRVTFEYDVLDAMAIGGVALYVHRGDGSGYTSMIADYKVEDVEEEKVTMTSNHKFSEKIPFNTIKVITEWASEIALNGWHDVTFQTPWGKIIAFPTEPPQPAPLKPCPFCGGGGSPICLGGQWKIRCLCCDSFGMMHEVKSDAIAAWNRRTP